MMIYEGMVTHLYVLAIKVTKKPQHPSQLSSQSVCQYIGQFSNSVTIHILH